MKIFQPISHSSGRGGISQITEKGSTTQSSLLVSQALTSDTGQYACHSSVGEAANVTVHVIRSEYFVPSELEEGDSSLFPIFYSFQEPLHWNHSSR